MNVTAWESAPAAANNPAQRKCRRHHCAGRKPALLKAHTPLFIQHAIRLSRMPVPQSLQQQKRQPPAARGDANRDHKTPDAAVFPCRNFQRTGLLIFLRIQGNDFFPIRVQPNPRSRSVCVLSENQRQPIRTTHVKKQSAFLRISEIGLRQFVIVILRNIIPAGIRAILNI